MLISALALFTGACTTVGPDFKTPEAPVAKQWIDPESPLITYRDHDYSTWWEAFNDPVLNDLVQQAYEQNLSLQIAGLRVLEARAELGFAVGRLYPQSQQAAAGYSRSQVGENTETVFKDSFFGVASLGFDAAWELDFWGRFRRGVESADANLFANIAGYDDVLVTLTAEVARTYIVIRTFEERLTLAKGNVKIQEESLRIASVRFKHGAVTELDVQQAKSQLHSTQGFIPQLEISRRRAQNALSILLGLPPQDLSAILARSDGIPTVPAEVAIGIPAELLRRRPDIKQAELQAGAQSAKVGIAASDLYPSFSLFGTIGLLASDAGNSSISDLFEPESLTYTYGLSLRWNLFNYGRIRNRIRVQDARLEQLLVNYQNVVLQAAQEVKDALVGFVRSKGRAGFLEKSVDAAIRASKLAMIQYREGVVDYQRVLDTDRFLTDQQDNYTSTRRNIALNLITMYKALGSGWQMRMGQDFVPEHLQNEMIERTDWGDLMEIENYPSSDEEPGKNLWRGPDW
jgi:NodT family efflux transporter outer membrane factor (OMF) lipoprotein